MRPAKQQNVENPVLLGDMTDEQKYFTVKLEDIMVTRTETKLMNLKCFDRDKVKWVLRIVDGILK